MKQTITQDIVLKEFAQDVLHGFSQQDKSLCAKYLYDVKGSELFNQITRHPDYYLTQCELKILDQHKIMLSNLFKNIPFNLVELGPGEGIKTQILIEQFLKDSRNFNYIAIDISNKYLKQLQKKFKKQPKLKLKTINSDFFQGLNQVTAQSQQKNLVLFLGSSIGNFNEQNTREFFLQVWGNLQDGDYLLTGFDLRKDIQTLIKAYNDRDGITKQFNLNLLARINRELNSNLKPSSFEHFATYNVYSGAMESYLLSCKKQEIYIGALKQSFNFHEYEPIHVEYSHKYLISQVEEYAASCGYEIMHNFFDEKAYFLNSLWKVAKQS